MGERSYYACSATVNEVVSFFLWFSDDRDGVVLNGNQIATFPSRDALAQFCTDANLKLSDESTVCYDFDNIDAWIRDPNVTSMDINSLLNAWNMMDDFYNSSLGHNAIADDDLDLHQKLSLSSFTETMSGAIVDENYEPEWTVSDMSRLAAILDECTGRFKALL